MLVGRSAHVWVVNVGSAIRIDELSILKLRHPVAEGVNVEYIVLDNIHVYVDRLYLIFVLWVVDEVVADEEITRCAFADITIHEVGATLNHTLVDKFAEWLVLTDIAEVEEEFIPETAIDKVTRSVLCTTDIEINLTPVFVGLFAHESSVVVVVHIAEIVCRRTRETRHGAKFKREDIDIVNQRLRNHFVVLLVPRPEVGIAERWLACGGRFEVRHSREFEWQARFWNHVWHAVFVVNWEGFTPVALAAEDCITEAVVHFHAAETRVGDMLLHALDSLFDLESVEEARIDHDTLFSIEALFADIGTLNEWDDRQVEVLSKRIVTAIVCRHSHDSTCTITT